MKRTLKGLLLTAMLAVPAVFAISSCSKSDPGTGGNQPSSPTETSQAPAETSQAPAHEHILQFDSFVWDKSVSGSWTAKAKLVCTADDGYSELKDAQVIRTGGAPTCVDAGGYHYKAVYMGNENEQDEVLSALGHDWNEPTWTWNADNSEATAKFVCKRDANHIELVVAKQSEGSIELLHMSNPHCTTTGLDKYVATVDFHGKQYKGEKEVVIPATGHMYNIFGYCLDDAAYLGEEIPTPREITLPDMDVGDKAYFKYKPLLIGHLFYYSCSSLIDETEVRFGVRKNLSFNTAYYSKTPTEITESEVSDDGFIYICINAQTAKSGAKFSIFEDHNWNVAGYCNVEGCEDNFRGTPLTVGEASESITYSAGEVLYFYTEANPGHVYKMTSMGSGLQSSEFTAYYLGAEGVPQVYSLNSDAFPADAYINYLFLVANPTLGGTGPVKVDIKSHPVGEMGYCDAHPTEFTGQVLTEDTDSTPVNLAPGEVAYYKFIITQANCFIEVYYDFDHYHHDPEYSPNGEIDDVFFKVDDVFFECSYNEMSGPGCTVWDKSNTRTFEIGDVVIVKVENKWSFNMDNLVININQEV